LRSFFMGPQVLLGVTREPMVRRAASLTSLNEAKNLSCLIGRDRNPQAGVNSEKKYAKMYVKTHIVVTVGL
jgi:hypothetical protein